MRSGRHLSDHGERHQHKKNGLQKKIKKNPLGQSPATGPRRDETRGSEGDRTDFMLDWMKLEWVDEARAAD